MKLITKEHILKAIQEIDNEGVRPGRNSSTYDLIFKEKEYPPKYVISLANKYATGNELDHNSFSGGQGTPAFNLLKNEGFVIKNKIDLAKSNTTKFSEAISEFIEYLKISDSIISAFTFGSYSTRSKYVWISDQFNIISDGNCHYELIERKQIDGTKGISAEIHFEDKYKKEYFSLLKDILPTDVCLNEQHKPNISFAYKHIIDYSDPNFFVKLEAALAYLELELGSEVRKIKNKMSEKNFKSDFINWFISNDGKVNNYFTQQFGGSIDRFTNEVNKYEEIYKRDFGGELFIINPKNIKDKIEELQENIYSNSPGFSEYSQGNSNGRPKAILGRNNYMKFLREIYFSSSRESENIDKQNRALNQILYGPPGTGKTYNTMNKAVCIIHPDFSKIENREILKAEYELLLESGQIVFTTFHQSMSYEDFIEGIKPQTKNDLVTYSVKDGVFKTTVKLAMSEYIKSDVENDSDKVDFDKLYDSFIESIKSEEGIRKGTFTTKTGIEMMLVNANHKSIIVKYLWDNNKTRDTEAKQPFPISKEKLKKVLLEGIDPSKVKSLLAELHPLIGHIHCELFAVYKSFYEFVIANKGEVEAVHFNYEDQSYDEIKEQYDALDKELIKEKLVKPYVLIIDEINRGNVSQIFGELITLIEESKRLGNTEELQVTLPYSKEKFGVPSNLYIIGTMNTADRSVEALDTALRRRFSFVEMMPDVSVVEKEIFSDNFQRAEIMQRINERIELLLDRNYTLGHSYFIKEDFKSSFKNEIIPLLQEYFYNDCSKIGLILGKGFVREKEISKSSQKNVFADFYTRSEVDILKTYELIPFEEVAFEEAISLLLGGF